MLSNFANIVEVTVGKSSRITEPDGRSKERHLVERQNFGAVLLPNNRAVSVEVIREEALEMLNQRLT